MAWSKPNPQASGDKAGPLLLKEVANTIDIYAKLNLLKSVHIGSSSPVGPDSGQLWMDSTATPHKLMRYTGSAWIRLADKHLNLVTKVANYTLDDEDDIVLLDGTSTTVQITLPTAVGITGREYILKAIMVGNTCTVVGTGGETIEGVATYTFAAVNDSIVVYSDNSDWRIKSKARPSFRGALINMSAVQAINSGVPTELLWDTETYDTDTLHDTGSNTGRLTIPFGVTKVRLHATVWFTDSGSSYINQIELFKNGAQTGYKTINEAGSTLTLSTPVLPVSITNYFIIKAYHLKGSAMNVGGTLTTFAMEIIE